MLHADKHQRLLLDTLHRINLHFLNYLNVLCMDKCADTTDYTIMLNVYADIAL